MSAVLERKINALTRTIVRGVHPEKILLFGSQARGTAGPASDVDLMVVEKEPFGPGRSRREEIIETAFALPGSHRYPGLFPKRI